MNQSLLLLVCMHIFSCMLYSQTSSFDLSKYKLPEVKRKQLDVKFDFNESSDKWKTESESGFRSNYDNFSFDNLTNVSYSSFSNSQKFQGEQYCSVLFSPEFIRSKNVGVIDRSNIFNLGLNIFSLNRIYFRRNYFFQPDFRFSGISSIIKTDKESNDSKTNDERSSYSIAIPLQVGKGRIEPIQDARLAIYIFEDLHKIGRITRIPDDEEIIEFSTLISHLKNKRYFDYRLRRIAEIEKVDSFLQAKGLVKLADVLYFTSIYDNWEYSAGPHRKTGNRFSVGINPTFSYNYNYTRTVFIDPPVEKNETRNKNYGIQFVMSFIKEIPINLYWQESYGFDASYNIKNNEWMYLDDDIEEEMKDRYFSTGGFYEIGYFPNSRTDMGVRLYLDARYHKTKYGDSSFDHENLLQLFPGFAFNLNYYISPQLRLQVDFNALYEYSNEHMEYIPENDNFDSQSNRLKQELKIGFLYSIF